MQTTTLQAMKSLLRTDGTLTKKERREIAQSIKRHGQPPPEENTPSLISRKDVAKLLHRTTRSVDDLANEGILERVMLPGRQRAAGFRKGDVIALIEGKQ